MAETSTLVGLDLTAGSSSRTGDVMSDLDFVLVRARMLSTVLRAAMARTGEEGAVVEVGKALRISSSEVTLEVVW